MEDGITTSELMIALLVFDEGLQIGVKALVQDELPGSVSLRIRTMEETLMFRLVQVLDANLGDLAESATSVPQEHQDELVPSPPKPALLVVTCISVRVFPCVAGLSILEHYVEFFDRSHRQKGLLYAR